MMFRIEFRVLVVSFRAISRMVALAISSGNVPSELRNRAQLEYCQRVQIGSVTALFSDVPGEGPEMS
jgi:hypothetical protein